MTAKEMTADEFDEYFDAGGDITPFVVDGTERFPNRDDAPRKVNLSMPSWLVDELDATARHLGNTRQGVINMWLAERVLRERREMV